MADFKGFLQAPDVRLIPGQLIQAGVNWIQREASYPSLTVDTDAETRDPAYRAQHFPKEEDLPATIVRVFRKLPNLEGLSLDLTGLDLKQMDEFKTNAQGEPETKTPTMTSLYDADFVHCLYGYGFYVSKFELESLHLGNRETEMREHQVAYVRRICPGLKELRLSGRWHLARESRMRAVEELAKALGSFNGLERLVVSHQGSAIGGWPDLEDCRHAAVVYITYAKINTLQRVCVRGVFPKFVRFDLQKDGSWSDTKHNYTRLKQMLEWPSTLEGPRSA
ncbi:Uu.00g101600.m01.CDS01 [Anthostomella pinea]|uniref:Uu.00g101600.m01.CDS01 n=1 Tax=Anthostomella pinea TaxID=933095 RepID=A0AAI8VE76_9PEZI|nr:Uu.00g101600.m01.CDS01 [Anthostomella pinea]